MSESVVPYKRFEYDTSFMDQVDTLNPETGPNIYLCFFSLTKGEYGYYRPRKSVIKAFASASDKEQFKSSTDEHNITTIDETTIYYFLMLLGINQFLMSGESKDMNDGNSAKSKYGKIYDAILESYSKNNCCIIYASDIDRADTLFKEAVKKGTITLTSEDITKKDDKIEQKYRKYIDKNINATKKAEAEQKKIAAAEENKIKGKERSKLIQDEIASIPETVDLRWQVFTVHDIGDTIVSENKVLPKFSKPVSAWDPTKPPITINSSDYKKVIPSNDTVVAIPDDFSWVKKVNESKSIHVIKVKQIYRPSDLAKSPKYTILGQQQIHNPADKPDIIAQSYEVTIEKLVLNERLSDDELEFKKRMIIPFIGESENSGEKYFVLNAEDEIAADAEVGDAGADDAREIKVLRYFLRKYGICYVESPVEKKYTFKFTHDDYINIEINTNRWNPTYLTFGNTPIGLFDAIPIVLHCLKNNKLLMKQIDNGPSTPAPEVLVLSQLTKDKINSATSVYFVVEKNTKHRIHGDGGVHFFGEIDGFTGPVIMHEKQWSLGCVQSILDEPTCTNYNELTLLAGTGDTQYNINGYKQYLTSGIFPDSFSLVIRGSDEYCKFVALEPYGNVFDKNWIQCKKYDQCFDWVIPRPGLGLEDVQHPVFYIFNAANKASAVNAFNAKLEEEMKKVILVEDGKNVVNNANLDSNPFLKTFKSYNKDGRGDAVYIITPFVKSITDETPKIDVLIPENIELVESNENGGGGGGGQNFAWMSRSDIPSPRASSSSTSSASTGTRQSSNSASGPRVSPSSSSGFGIGAFRFRSGGKSNKKRTKKSRRNKVRSNKRNVRSNKRATRSNKRKYNNTRKK